jgi:hypothetical protein
VHGGSLHLDSSNGTKGRAPGNSKSGPAASAQAAGKFEMRLRFPA